MNALWSSVSNLVRKKLLESNSLSSAFDSFLPKRFANDNGYLAKLHFDNIKRQNNPEKYFKKKPKVLNGQPFAKGVVLKTVIKKPRKPNSASRKCVLVKLSTGKQMVAYVPGEGHLLQEHNVVLCKVAKLKDVPGVKIKCVRGKYDLPHVQKKSE